MVLAALALSLLFIPATAQAFTTCGQDRYGVQLRFHNPDLNAWNDPVPEGYPVDNDPDIVESSWHAFIQFQAVVNESRQVAQDMGLLDEIETFWFGFGPIKEAAVAGPLDNCEKPWAPGIQIYSSFSDTDPGDGFHIGLNTTLVPDGSYGAIVYACTESTEDRCKPDGDDDLVAATWSRVLVYNGQDQCGPDDRECMRQVDFVKPWPKVLPGDGGQTEEAICEEIGADLARCLTIEFSEDIQDLRFTFNGVDRSDEVTLQRRTDGSDPSELGYSETYAWEAPRAFERNDELRVRATDRAGNVANKTISFRDDTRGGVIPLIRADVDVTVEPDRRRVRPGESKTFQIHLRNTGADTAHVFPSIRPAEGAQAKIADDHIDVPGGANATVLLQAGPTANASEGEYPIETAFEYIAGNRRRSTKVFPTVVADEDAPLAARRQDDNGTDPVEALPSGFNRQCRTPGQFEVCFVYPPNLTEAATFPFEAQVAQASDRRTDRHEVDAGRADLTVQYLSADADQQVASPSTFPMQQVSTGRYRANVTLQDLAPTVNVIFSSERVEASMVIREPAEPAADTTGAQVPGMTGVAALLAAGLVAAWTRRR